MQWSIHSKPHVPEALPHPPTGHRKDDHDRAATPEHGRRNTKQGRRIIDMLEGVFQDHRVSLVLRRVVVQLHVLQPDARPIKRLTLSQVRIDTGEGLEAKPFEVKKQRPSS